jgi:hypothetical protein
MKNIISIIILCASPFFMTAQEVRGTSQNQYGGAVTGINTVGWGVYGEGKGAGVFGKNTGTWIGVYGESPNYFGVMGSSTSSAGVAGQSVKWIGVYGESAQNEGVRGVAKGRGTAGVVGIGATMGVFGKSEDPNGTAIMSDGKLTTKTLEILGGSDIAEHFKSSAPKTTLEAGTLMIADEKTQGDVIPSSVAYDKKVVGVVSGANGIKTGMTLRQEGTLEGDAVIAVAGRVYVKASTINGKIKVGDMLTSSDIKGYAMKATHKRKSNGTIIGKALTSLDDKEGLVLMLVNLQ